MIVKKHSKGFFDPDKHTSKKTKTKSCLDIFSSSKHSRKFHLTVTEDAPMEASLEWDVCEEFFKPFGAGGDIYKDSLCRSCADGRLHAPILSSVLDPTLMELSEGERMNSSASDTGYSLLLSQLREHQGASQTEGRNSDASQDVSLVVLSPPQEDGGEVLGAGDIIDYWG